MSNTILEEGNLRFEFTNYLKAEKFDVPSANPHGLEPVDFVAESIDCLYFIEVKDYQHPHPKAVARRETDHRMLYNAALKKGFDAEGSLYCHKIGSKLKDSILQKYATGEIDKDFKKRIVYLFIVNLDVFTAEERGMLKERISNHVPKGKKDSHRGLFFDMFFDLVNAEQLKEYGITCTEIN